jgi:hypothetical protein
MEHLEELEIWDKSFSKRIEAAAESNTQIFGAYGVLDRVNALIKKWAKSGF